MTTWFAIISLMWSELCDRTWWLSIALKINTSPSPWCLHVIGAGAHHCPSAAPLSIRGAIRVAGCPVSHRSALAQSTFSFSYCCLLRSRSPGTAPWMARVTLENVLSREKVLAVCFSFWCLHADPGLPRDARHKHPEAWRYQILGTFLAAFCPVRTYTTSSFFSLLLQGIILGLVTIRGNKLVPIF